MSIKAVKKVEKKEEPKRQKRVTRRSLIEDKIKLLESMPKNNEVVQKQLEELYKQLKSSKRGQSSKRKGASYERSIAQVFKTGYDIDLVRTPQSGGFAKKSTKADEFRGDITTVDKDIELLLHIECKDHKTWSLKEWLKQAQEDCPTNKIPIVVMKKDNTNAVGEKGNQQDLVVIDLKDFMKLVPKERIIKRK